MREIYKLIIEINKNKYIVCHWVQSLWIGTAIMENSMEVP